MVGRFRNTFRGYRRSWSCLTHLVRVRSPTHCDQCDQLWRIRGVGIPRKPSVQQKSAHNLGVMLPWFKEQWDRQGGALCPSCNSHGFQWLRPAGPSWRWRRCTPPPGGGHPHYGHSSLRLNRKQAQEGKLRCPRASFRSAISSVHVGTDREDSQHP